MGKSKFDNTNQKSFLESIPTISIDTKDNNIAQRCKFNFSYFINGDLAGQDFKDWNHKQLYELFDKLKEYSKFSLSHWKNKKQGNYPVFVNYTQFPTNTDFIKPKSIPHQAVWSRFHLEGDSRLIGFVLPDEYKDKEQNNSGFKFDINTFYIVYLDEQHKFYKTR
jgi:hypothetical protein